jgi:pilus assembly protein CpaB
MKRAQLIGIAIAAGAGLLAFVGMKSAMKAPPKQIVERSKLDTVQVLVAQADIALGSIANEQNFGWMEWPSSSVSPGFITNAQRPTAKKDFAGAVARSPILKGEPITESKLIKAGSGGVLAAILPPGMRAISTKISEQTAVGKLILPNDHVDVILTRRARGRNGAEEHVSDTLFRNVRVLAIGQQIEVKEGKKNSEGNVATLELTPRQTELLALANSMGEISLALRSVADLNASATGPAEGQEFGKAGRANNSIRVLRYGVKSRAYGVN